MNIKVRQRHRPQKPRTCGRHTRPKKLRQVSLTQLTNMTSAWSNQWSAPPPPPPPPPPRAPARQFDSDSHDLMLDDGASACITNCKDDFVEPPKRVDRKVKGIKGHADATHRGTLKWYLEDDTGLVHVIMIQGSYLIPDATTRILSPQHLAQQANDHYPKEEGTGSLTTSKNITLFWSQRRFTKTVPLDPRTIVGLTTTAAGTRSYCAFCASINEEETKETNIFTTHVIPADEDDESFQPKDPVAPPTDEEDEPVASTEQHYETPGPGPSTTLVDLGPISHVIPEDAEPTSLNPHDELLRWHYRMGHLPFDQIKQLAQMEQLPKRLLTVKKPFFAACQYGKMTKRPWRVKGGNKHATKTATQQGEVVSVDQLESNSPGLIAQLKGKLTRQRYKYATIFVDQFSGYTFVFLQRRLTSEETVQAKHAFERSLEQRRVKIRHYHADNGRFADNAFIQDCKTQGRSMSYCGVNAYFQNGIAQRHIRDLQEQTRTSMLYAMSKWREMILISLWPYVMRHANDVANATPKKAKDNSPLELFSGVKVAPKLRHFHSFGCPTYVLDNALQSGQGTPKWRQRFRLGVYLGPSPNHARSVALVLNPRTGHVSPQFHVKFDDFFETVQQKATDLDAPDPEWKYLSGFAIHKGQPRPIAKEPLGDLIAPRRGPTTAPLPAAADQATQQPLPNTSQDNEDMVPNVDEPPMPVAQAPPTQQVPEQGPQNSAVRQTRSGRVVTNTSRYNQSMTQRSQGLVAC